MRDANERRWSELEGYGQEYELAATQTNDGGNNNNKMKFDKLLKSNGGGSSPAKLTAKLAKQAAALSVGLPLDSPYVTEKPGEAYYFYRVGGIGGPVRRETAVKLKAVEEVAGLQSQQQHLYHR